MAMDRWGRGATLAFVALAMAGCDTLSLLLGFPEPVVAVHSALPVELAYREGRGGIVLLTGRVNGKADVDFVLDTGAPRRSPRPAPPDRRASARSWRC